MKKKIDKVENALTISTNQSKKLTKNQQLFNNLSNRIEKLELEIAKNTAKYDRLLDFHVKDLNPLEIKIANQRIKLAMVLDDAYKNEKFTKKQKEKIEETILTLCDEAFGDIEPSPEQEAFYDSWAEVSYKEEIEQDIKNSKNYFADFINTMYGTNINNDDFENLDNAKAKIEEKLKDHENQYQSQYESKSGKKHQARIEAHKAKEEIQTKNLRSIYIALAKILHPDTETDPALKAEKEELMKKVTSAYEQKDLKTLLKLEMEWVHQTTEFLEKLSDDKLKIYISALKQQAYELENEMNSIRYNPRYEAISDYMHFSEKVATSRIKEDKIQLDSILYDLNNFITDFSKPNAKTEILHFVTEYCNLNEMENSFFPEDQDFWDDDPFVKYR